MSPTHENYSGEVLQIAIGGHFTKNIVLTPPTTGKMENTFLCGN
jgi:hypothetical protein